MKKKKVLKHLKGDIKTIKKEAKEDKELVKELKKPVKKVAKSHEKKETKSHEKKEKKNKVAIDIDLMKKGKLHSGSKKGPIVKNPKQAIAIGLSQEKKSKKKHKN